jgi:hypothetical protein
MYRPRRDLVSHYTSLLLSPELPQHFAAGLSKVLEGMCA